MSAITGFTNATFLAERAKEFLIEGAYNDASISEILSVIPDINTKKQVVYANRFDKVLLSDGGCNRQVGTTKNIVDKEKMWTPALMEAWLSICNKDFWGTVASYQNANGNTRLESPDLTKIVLDMLNDAIAKDLVRQAWFNDADAAAYTSAGKLLTADDAKNYNQYTGFFEQISEAITSGSIKNVVLSENAKATTAAQLPLAADRTLDLLVKMEEMADSRLTSGNDGLIFMTKELFFNLKNSLRLNKNLESSKSELVNGFKSLSFDGYTIVNMDIWSRYITSDFRKDATSLYSPHRIVWAPKTELMLGVDVLPSSQIATWFDQTTQFVHARTNFVADAKIGREYLFVTAGCE